MPSKSSTPPLPTASSSTATAPTLVTPPSKRSRQRARSNSTDIIMSRNDLLPLHDHRHHHQHQHARGSRTQQHRHAQQHQQPPLQQLSFQEDSSDSSLSYDDEALFLQQPLHQQHALQQPASYNRTTQQPEGFSQRALPSTDESYFRCSNVRDDDDGVATNGNNDTSNGSLADCLWSIQQWTTRRSKDHQHHHKHKHKSPSFPLLSPAACMPTASTAETAAPSSKALKFKLSSTRIAQAVSIILAAWLVGTACLVYQHDHLGVGMMDAAAVGTTFAKHHPASSSSVSVGAPLVRSNIPLPLPKQKVSVILMNFSRPRMIRESSTMRTLLSHPNVDEVLLLHSNPKTAFEFDHPKVVNVDAIRDNEEMGLSLRFYHCQLAKNEWVLHLDDDVEFTSAALDELLIEYGRNPRRIVGRFGRNMSYDDPVIMTAFNGYSSAGTHKSSEVMLTRLMVMERETCSAFFQYSHLLWDDIVLHDGEGPLWNGEDIFMSLVANHIYGPPTDGRPFNNYAMDWLDVWTADESLKDYSNGKLDISGGCHGISIWDWKWWQTLFRRNRHYAYRGKLWQTAKER
eukprot:CAMPEP_0119565866 /NCGR_PEP_ID=MMETSP1352-20130426/31357_1 /TAXON_ID=265584 /ORGANISM="Stauroneis constricta, Strain CCMP1120" /LENGTH=570 /DNA_ID=CAMNT_0007614875 /DNA_START=451 /DNA_END=2159 /DNA_ORIENTATION=-